MSWMSDMLQCYDDSLHISSFLELSPSREPCTPMKGCTLACLLYYCLSSFHPVPLFLSIIDSVLPCCVCREHERIRSTARYASPSRCIPSIASFTPHRVACASLQSVRSCHARLLRDACAESFLVYMISSHSLFSSIIWTNTRAL